MERERRGRREGQQAHEGRLGHGKGGDRCVFGGLAKGEIWLLNLILLPSN